MERAQAETLVAVTGAGGFIALHCVRELLERGYGVRGTVRDLASEDSLRNSLLPLAPDRRLTFVQADLLSDAGWEAAFQGVTYVLHVASPVPKRPPRDEQDVIRPAREGTLRVLAAARAAGVARVVMTSSTTAIVSGRESTAAHVFDENDWADLAGPMSAYERSKTLAERAAWDFARASHGEGPELVVLNPGYVLGPSLTGAENTSNEIVGKLLRREVPGYARLQFPLVDVRDVAAAHVLAMTTSGAAGQRILLMSECAWMREIVAVLAAAGYKVPTRELPDFVVRLVGVFDPTVRLVTHHLSKPTRMSATKARSLLGWSGRSMADMVLDTAKAMTEQRRSGSSRLKTG